MTTKIRNVARIQAPARAWCVELAEGAFVSCRAFPERLAVIELFGTQLRRTDFMGQGDRAERAFERGWEGDFSGARVGLFPVGNTGVCVMTERDVWLCHDGSCALVPLDGRKAVSAVLRSNLTLELSAVSEDRSQLYRYSVTDRGVDRHDPSPVRAPLRSVFDFPELGIDIFSEASLTSAYWAITLRRPGCPPRTLGEPVEIWSMFWFDGWLVIRDDIKRGWAIPIFRDNILDHLLFDFAKGISRRFGVELVPGSRRVLQQAARVLGSELDDWILQPFSRYSTRTLNESLEHTKLQWSCLDTSNTGVWEFSHPAGARILLDPDPNPR